MFVLHPDPYLLPSYRISPFTTSDIGTNNELPESDAIDDYLNTRFSGKEYHYVADGRKAIHIALEQYNLQPNDVVTIFTTSGNFYISSCVTKEIEKFCKWSRKIEDNTKLIFVNHEFGYPFNQHQEITKSGLPVIEDCCHSFFSADEENVMGNMGDYAIYSFPKMFPVQFGGLLIAAKKNTVNADDILSGIKLRYLKNVLSHYITQKASIIAKRLDNYIYLRNNLNTIGFEERFALNKHHIPGVYMFRTKNENVNLPLLKDYLYAHGIQCSVFYGEQTFFIPVHQNLTKTDLDYFTEVIRSFTQ